jgi:cytochrome c oxidase cbb3-type subunit 3
MRKIKLYTSALLLLFLAAKPVYAAEGPKTSFMDNPLAVTLLVLIALLLLIIGLLSNVLLGTADFKVNKDKKENPGTGAAKTLTVLLMLAGSSAFAQDNTGAAIASNTIGGMSTTTFYVLTAVIFLELFVIMALLINIRMLLKTEKERAIAVAEKKPAFNWWNRFNRFKPVEQEADIDLGHNYDGIRELDNRLPPWWLYGFYITIVFAGIYLWRFHVTHTGPSSVEEYQASVTKAEAKIKDYLKQKGEAVDENTVTVLTAADDLAEGKKIFISACASCHKADGGGDVGPNLTDDYWMHGNDIKSIFKTIRYGVNAMPQWQNSYSNKQIAQVSSYIKSLHGTKPAAPKAPQGNLFKEDAAPAGDSTSNASVAGGK